MRRIAHRRNPAVYAQDIRPGDTLQIDGLGREHVIEGPYRSGRGIRFVDQHGNGVMLKPNEVVNVVARGNPSKRSGLKRRANPRVREVSRVGTLQQRVAALLNGAGLLRRETRFRETSRGGLQANGVDSDALAQNPWMLDQLDRIARRAGYSFSLHGGSFLMAPEQGMVVGARGNPSRRGIVRRKAPKRVVKAYRSCVRAARGGSRNPWASCRRKIAKTTRRMYRGLRNPTRGLRYEVWIDRGGKYVPVHASDRLSKANDRAHLLNQHGQYAYVQDAATGRIVGPYTHDRMQYRARNHARATMPAIVLSNPRKAKKRRKRRAVRAAGAAPLAAQIRRALGSDWRLIETDNRGSLLRKNVRAHEVRVHRAIARGPADVRRAAVAWVQGDRSGIGLLRSVFTQNRRKTRPHEKQARAARRAIRAMRPPMPRGYRRHTGDDGMAQADRDEDMIHRAMVGQLRHGMA